MPTSELITSSIIVAVSIIGLFYFAVRVRNVLHQEKQASEIIQNIIVEISRRMKQQDMRILDQQFRLDLIDVRRNQQSVPSPKIGEAENNVGVEPFIESNLNMSRDITKTELDILKLLNDGGKSPTEIQKIVGLSREHVSRIMKEIYSRGFVSRHTGVRPYQYTLTAEGRKLIDVTV